MVLKLQKGEMVADKLNVAVANAVTGLVVPTPILAVSVSVYVPTGLVGCAGIFRKKV